MECSQKAGEITPFLVMEVMEKAAELERRGDRVVHLEVGEPDFDTPRCIKAAACRALEEGKTHYTHSQGIVELREAICEYHEKKYGVAVSPGRVLVTSGTSPAMTMVFAALLEPDDEIILPDPCYACYPNFIRLHGGKCVFVPAREEDGFQVRPEEIRRRITKRTRGIVINSPSNPTGNLLSEPVMAQVADLGVPVISDEIYHGLVYEGRERSILEFTERAVVVNGFSKQFAMTGWRVGYLILPEKLVRPMQKIHQNCFICANSFVQWAAIAALREADEDVRNMRRIYDERRRVIIDGLRELGFGVTVEPTGAFYVLANARWLSQDSYGLAFDILEKAHVGVTPGIDFGSNAEGYLRFSYARSVDEIRLGLSRLKDYLSTNR
jgi:aspartate/methionine/tyrosine aminotransferase